MLKAADQRYQAYLQEDMSAGQYPPYKASGMAYIRFAREQRELFKLLFMRDRTNEEKAAGEELEALLSLIRQSMGLSREEAYRFHMEMWIYVHGIATMIAKRVKRKRNRKRNEKKHGCNPNRRADEKV